jgi:hypothetical protein
LGCWKAGPWCAVATEGGGGEYLAQLDLRRFGILVWLPERRRVVRPKDVEPFFQFVPLLPRRLLVPLHSARDAAFWHCRGVERPKWLVAGEDGKPLCIPDNAVRELLSLAGHFDEDRLGGNIRRLKGRELLAAVGGDELAEAFAPLFPKPKIESHPMRLSKAELLAPSPTRPTPSWIQTAHPVSAAESRDVRERAERPDDRPSWEIAASSSRALAARRAAQGPNRPRYTYGAQARRADLVDSQAGHP